MPMPFVAAGDGCAAVNRGERMTDFLVRRFVKNSDQTEDRKVREAYGRLSSIVGIVCNVLLFGVKYTIGLLSHSITILSDAFNNLSDSASCLVTLFGYKLAAKPADKDHPFGHGRIEYLTTLTIAVIILLVGFELLRDAVDKLLHPQALRFSMVSLAVLLVSIGVKVWMAFFNFRLGRRIRSGVLIATAKDSRNDVIATAAAVMALVAAPFTSLPVDGAMGVLVSLFVLKAGYDIIRDTVDDLLGKPADPALVDSIVQLVQENPRILGLHDLMIHSYGPGNVIGSCHVEVRSDEDFVQIHDMVDTIERQIHDQLHVLMTIHMDPIEVDNAQVTACREQVAALLHDLDDRLCLHDFRLVTGDTHINAIFDVVLPFDCPFTPSQIKGVIDDGLNTGDVTYYTVITFDQAYTEI